MPEQITDGTGTSQPANPLKITDENEALVRLNSMGSGLGVDVLAGYKASEQDRATMNIQYFGFLDVQGGWYMMRQSGATTNLLEFRYAAGSADLTTNWTNRGSITFGLFNNVF